jgi:hypothetical protein
MEIWGIDEGVCSLIDRGWSEKIVRGDWSGEVDAQVYVHVDDEVV